MARTRDWKGHLKLSLVTARVSLTAATTQSRKIRFHLINRDTGNRVEARYFDSKTHRPVSERNEVKGFPKDGAEDDFVLLDDDEIDSAALESTRTINIEAFVPAGSVAWIWYEKAHFLKPDDDLSEEAYGVILQSMREHQVLGIARLVLYGRERAVLLEPLRNGIILWTLRYGETVRGPVVDLHKLPKPDAAAMTKLEKTIEKKCGTWRPSLVKDPMQKRLSDIVKAHRDDLRPAKAPAHTPPAKTGRIVDITEALRNSLRNP
ncbi:non-homologous end joining protein Ku [Rhizobium sp. C1]|uniref:non-homologous end joining protein Ku n=1 Tax=Rhizobium sp. C1 TaxID=1349799 RepID=UPI001E5F8256|nr:Ku protein [Rhizobium sp. C1]MCD2178129.1 Ku protein [Rhizobium sp. C1]